MNKMTVEELRQALADMSLSSKGTRDQLSKRLRSARRREQEERERSARIPPPPPPRDPAWQPYDFYLVFDVEATCQEDNRNFHQEIIEFPIILICGRTLTILDEFHRYVRPVLHPTLSPYCTNLTGITQSTVDAAPIFPEVLDEFEDWLSEHDPYPFRNSVFVTDGPWDIRDFVPRQMQASKMPCPPYFKKKYVNLRRMYETFYIGRGARKFRRGMEVPESVGEVGGSGSAVVDGAAPDTTVEDPGASPAAPSPASVAQPPAPVPMLTSMNGKGAAKTTLPGQLYARGTKMNLAGMLAGLGMEFEGRPHSGIDDARNIARITVRMMEDGARLGSWDGDA
ncbi:3'-5' exoribonuclease 1 [Phlyctochytrium bullatum]|nr:3'-5' exoribonuclease 1 [Phlyctochytrium bullatum]